MHRCPGNDDYENKKIYEESLHPEGITKTIKINDNVNWNKRRIKTTNFSKEEFMNQLNSSRGKVRFASNNKRYVKIILLVIITISFYIGLMVAIFGL